MKKKNFKVLEDSRIYVDPHYNPGFFVQKFDVLPFLIDHAIIYDPSKKKIERWGYNFERFLDFVEAGIIIPLSPGDEFLKEYPEKRQIVRSEVINTNIFFADYDRAVQDDLNDPGFLKIAKSLSKGKVIDDLNDVAFSLNWDLIVTSALHSPILYDDRQQTLWNYKIGTAIGLAPENNNLSEIEQMIVLQKFLYRAIGKLPIHLPVDTILDFRRDNAAINFRKWLRDQVGIAMDAKKEIQIEIDEHLFQEFKELSNSYQKKSTRLGAVATGALAVSVGLVAGPIGGVASLGGQLIFPSIIRKLQAKYSHNNWALLLVDIKKKDKMLT